MPKPRYALRLANESDLSDVMRWRNDPETRYFRNDPRPVEPEEHKRWFEHRMVSDSLLYIYTIDDVPAGNVTLDPDPESVEIACIIAPEFRGKRHGTRMMQMGLDIVPPDKIVCCQVRRDNAASIAMVKACGFVDCCADESMVYYNHPERSREARLSREAAGKPVTCKFHERRWLKAEKL